MGKDPIPEGLKWFLLGDTAEHALALRSCLILGSMHKSKLEELKSINEERYWQSLAKSAFEGGGDSIEDARLIDRLWDVKWERDAAIFGFVSAIAGIDRAVRSIVAKRFGNEPPAGVKGALGTLEGSPAMTNVMSAQEGIAQGRQPDRSTEGDLYVAWDQMQGVLASLGEALDPKKNPPNLA